MVHLYKSLLSHLQNIRTSNIDFIHTISINLKLHHFLKYKNIWHIFYKNLWNQKLKEKYNYKLPLNWSFLNYRFLHMVCIYKYIYIFFLSMNCHSTRVCWWVMVNYILGLNGVSCGMIAYPLVENSILELFKNNFRPTIF